MTYSTQQNTCPWLRGSRGAYPYNNVEYLEAVISVEDVAFGDESGTDGGAEWCVVAGFVASPRQWERFDEQWREVLALEGVSAFHGLDFFQRRRHQSSKSSYQGWSHDRLSGFLQRLLSVVEWNNVRPVSVAVDVAAFSDQPPAYRAFLSGAAINLLMYESGATEQQWSRDEYSVSKAYFPAFTRFMQGAVHNARPTANVRLIMDENDTYEAMALRLWREAKDGNDDSEIRRVTSLSFADDECHPGLQAADLMASVVKAVISKKALTSFHEAAFDALSKKPMDLLVLDRERLQRDGLAVIDIVDRYWDEARELYRKKYGRLP